MKLVRVHDIKLHHSVWSDVVGGKKPWEFRKNDRDYRVGDYLYLRWYDDESDSFRNGFIARVTYIIHGPSFGVPDGFCVMTIVPATYHQKSYVIGRMHELGWSTKYGSRPMGWPV